MIILYRQHYLLILYFSYKSCTKSTVLILWNKIHVIYYSYMPLVGKANSLITHFWIHYFFLRVYSFVAWPPIYSDRWLGLLWEAFGCKQSRAARCGILFGLNEGGNGNTKLTHRTERRNHCQVIPPTRVSLTEENRSIVQ